MKQTLEKLKVDEKLVAEKIKAKHEDVEVKEKYDVLTILLLFFCFSFVGWILEIFWLYIKQGIIVNRGTLLGPWVPIYGYCCVGILVVYSSKKIKKITKSPFFTFLTIAISCSIVEYITSFVLEKRYGLRWWDYSNEKFNINGRICLENTLLFGIGGCFCLYYVAPMFNSFIKKIPKKAKIVILIILIIFFVIDNVYCTLHPHTGEGITEGDKLVQKIIQNN